MSIIEYIISEETITALILTISIITNIRVFFMYELYKELEGIVCKENLITIMMILIACYIADTVLITCIVTFVTFLLDIVTGVYHGSFSFLSFRMAPVYLLVVGFINFIILLIILIRISILFIKGHIRRKP